MLIKQGITRWIDANWHRVMLVVANMGILAFQRVVQRIAGLVSLYFVARHLSLAEFGQYQFTAVALAALAFFALPGLDNAVMQLSARGSNVLYGRAVKFSIYFSFLGSILLLISAFVLNTSHPEMLGPLLIAAALFPPYLAMAQWKSVLVGEARFLKLAVLEGATAILTNGGLIAGVFLHASAPWVFVLLYLLPTALVNLVTTLFYLRRMKSLASMKESDAPFRYGLETSGVTAVSMIGEQVERLAIFLLIGPATLAIYIAGDRLSELVRSVFQDAAAVLAPRFSRMSTYEGRIERAILLISVAAGVAILLFAVTLAPHALVLIFGPTYALSIPFAQALLVSVAVGNVGQFQFRFIRSQLDSSSFRQITLWTTGVRIVGSLVLIKLFGVWGAVASLIIHRLAISIVSSAMIRRRYRTVAVVP